MKDHNMSNMNMEASGHKMKKEKHDMSNMAGMGMGKHNMDKMNNSKATVGIPYIEYLSDYKAIKSPNVTTLPKNNPKREVTLELTGVMERYVWSINNKIMAEADNIVIKKGENVKFKLVNKTMMNHPIHVHGHFFRVLNGQGEYSPLKHTVNVAPFETVEIEFLANEEKDWLFHCHNLYHMKLGMGGIIHYEGSPVNNHLNMGTHAAEHGDKWFNATEVNVYSNFTNGLTKFSNNNDELSIEYKHNYKKDYDIDVIYERYMSQFLSIYGGGNFEREESKRINRGIFGIHYVLPFLIEADLRIPTKGKVTLGVGSKLQLTDRTSFGWKWKTDKTYNFSLDYSMTKNLYISTNYDSKERWGLGLSIKF